MLLDTSGLLCLHHRAEPLHKAAVKLFDAAEQKFVLCDAVSFVLMERFGSAEALTTDHHFEQAGFGRLLVA